MTRINCVPPRELHTKHLVAEYRELPRVFKLAEAYYEKYGCLPPNAPKTYTLGPGHVLFFYDKLGYCEDRFESLVGEMLLRRYKPLHLQAPAVYVPGTWRRPWRPTSEDLRINRERIKERLPK